MASAAAERVVNHSIPIRNPGSINLAVVDRVLCSISLVLGFIHGWLGRNSMNPDGISYLDVGDAFVHHTWNVAVNGWWSPLYSWTLGLVINVFRPAPRWEFPLVHAVNVAVFACALMAFRLLLHSLLAFMSETADHKVILREQPRALTAWSLTLLAYALFLWVSLEVMTVYEVNPDLAVTGCICLTTAALLRLKERPTTRRALILGASLGLGFWTKTILLPLGVLLVLIATFWVGSAIWRKRMARAAVVFACMSLTFISVLSFQKGRVTIGDAGPVNYAWATTGASTRNWQGQPANSGTPVHSTRLIFEHPPVFEFDGPVLGTYPPWTDPSYWNEGVRAHSTVSQQLHVFAQTLPSEMRLLLRSQPAILAGLIALALLSGAAWFSCLGQLWPLIVIQIAGLAAYAPIIENDRYIGGFILVLFLLLFASVRIREMERRTANYLVVGVFIATALSTIDLTVRIGADHPAIPGNQPTMTAEDVAAAEQLWKLGYEPGQKAAVLGDGTGAYWARLGKFRLVAEVMDMGKGTKEFWSASDERRRQVYEAFARAHATFAVRRCPESGVPEGWGRLSGTTFCVRHLDQVTK